MRDRVRRRFGVCQRGWLRWLNFTSIRRDESGASLVEVALIFGLFAPVMVLGTVEVGGLVYDAIEVANAAHAGAAYAAQFYIGSSGLSLPAQTLVTTAAQNDEPEVTAFLASGTSLTVTMATGCNGGTATVGNAVPSCSGTTLPYVQVSTKATVVPLVRFYGLPSTLNIASQATMNLVN